MLDAFIIEQIKKREDAERQRRTSIQPSLPLPLPPPPEYNHHPEDAPRRGDRDEEDNNNGIYIIDMKPSSQHQLYHL